MACDEIKQSYFWILVILFVLSRILFLLFIHPSFFFDWEEDTSRGVLAKEIISGKLYRPLFDYQADHYAGGSLVVGLLVLPFFLVFGPSLFALKLVGLSFFTATFITWILFCLRHFNRNVAILSSVLFIFSPRFFNKMSVITMGFHSESILFTAVTISIFYEIFFRQQIKWYWFFCLGLVCGLGLWFAYIFGLTLLCMLLLWFFFDKKFLVRKSFLIFILGLLLGLVFWLYYNLTHKFQGLYIGEIPLHRFLVNDHFLNLFVPEKSVFLDFFFDMTTKLWRFKTNSAYFFIFIIFSVVLLWNKRRNILKSKESFFIIYPYVILIFCQLAFRNSDKYKFPALPVIFISLALFFDRLLNSNKGIKTAVSGALFFGIVSINFSSNMELISSKYIGYILKAKGYSYLNFGKMDANKCLNNISEIPKYFLLAKNIDINNLDAYFEGFAEEFFEKKFSKINIDEIINITQEFSKQIEQQYRCHFYRQIGIEIGKRFKEDKIDKVKEIISRIEPQYQHCVYESWVSNIGSNLSIDYESKKRMVTHIEIEYYPFFYQGLGEEPENIYCSIYKKIDEKYLPNFFKGVGHSIVVFSLSKERNVDVDKLFKLINKKYYIFIYKGIREEIAHFINMEPATIIVWNNLFRELPISKEDEKDKGREAFFISE